jgi:hypothetical protein
VAKRRKFTPELKARVVLEMHIDGKSLAQTSREYKIKDSVLSRRKAEFLERSPRVFEQAVARVISILIVFRRLKVHRFMIGIHSFLSILLVESQGIIRMRNTTSAIFLGSRVVSEMLIGAVMAIICVDKYRCRWYSKLLRDTPKICSI